MFMFTVSTSRSESALHVTNLARLAVGAKDPRIVRNFPKQTALLNVTVEDVLAQNLGNVVIFSVLEDAPVLSLQIAWHVRTSTMTGCASKNVPRCTFITPQNINGNEIPMENMPMEQHVSRNVQNICSKITAPV